MLAAALLAAPFLALARAALNASDAGAITQQFAAADLGGLVSNFTPAGLIDATFAGKAITIGQNISQTDAGNFPTLSINPVEGQNVWADNDTYTAMMVDANVVGTDLNGTNPLTLHWLINTIHVTGTSNAAGPFPLNYTGNGNTIVEYTGPAPPSGSGPHRYVLLVFAQPADFAAPAGYNQANTTAGPFDLKTYVTNSKLGNALAANYFTVQVGADNSTVSSIPAATSTIPAGAGTNATGTGAAGGAATSAPGGSGTASGSGAASTETKKSGASALVPAAVAVVAVAAVAALF